MMLKRYARESDVVYAVQWLGDNHGEIQELFPSDWKVGFASDENAQDLDVIFTKDYLIFKFQKTSGYCKVAKFGDWILRSGAPLCSDEDSYFDVLDNEEKLAELSDSAPVMNTDRGALAL